MAQLSRCCLAAALLAPAPLWAASCCGGGSTLNLFLPKYSQQMLDVSMAFEQQTGQYQNSGAFSQATTELDRQVFTLAYAHRLHQNWQLSASLPYAFNHISSATRDERGSTLGDLDLSLWYEAFDVATCTWALDSWRDLKPSLYLGAGITVPTGQSLYSADIDDAGDIFGKGAYRFDLKASAEKTIYPWTLTLNAAYGQHLERDVYHYLGQPISAYQLQLGDRFAWGVSLGYTYFRANVDTITTTLALAEQHYGEQQINGESQADSDWYSRKAVLALNYATANLKWNYKLSYSHQPHNSFGGANTSASDQLTLGVRYVFY